MKNNQSTCYFIFLLLLIITLGGCAATPNFKTEGVDLKLTPNRAVVESASVMGKTVIWGGVIISSTNLKGSTQLEILAYPLNPNQSPATNEQALGRFLAIQPGYLETTDYAQGRYVTVKGTLDGTRTGRVGESEYVYPLLNITQKHLWPKEGEYIEPRVRFGIGVMISN